ncbi:MAG: hypothetical protein IKH04_11010 [Kiritimatiellae bacterium]|nr:hypothetical protein [Kiritimatiellia bacterium]
MKPSTFAKSALALSFGMFAGIATATVSTTIVDEPFTTAFTAGTSLNGLTWTVPPSDASEVTGGRLVVDAADELTAAIDDAAAANAGISRTLTAKVKFVPATASPLDGTDSTLKFAIYALADSGSATTNLYLYNGSENDTKIPVDCSEDTTITFTFPTANQVLLAVGNATAGPYPFGNSLSGVNSIGFTGNGEVDQITYAYEHLATVNVTVTGGANATAAWTVDGTSVATAPTTLTEGQTYSVTYTANANYEFEVGATTSASGTAGTTDIVITIADAVSKGYTAGDAPIGGDSTRTISAEEAEFLNAIVGNKGRTDVESALKNISVDDFTNAALLNQDITASGAASATFEVTGVKKSGDNVVVDVKLTRNGSILGAIYGTVTLYSATTPNGEYTKQGTVEFNKDASADTATIQTFSANFTGVTGNFFKAKIE